MKKVPLQSIIGQQGVNLVERIVQKMEYIWRPTPIFDVGIDGEIEIREPNTNEMTNLIIKVQVKATTIPFQAETDNSFEYLCKQEDLNYWLQGNVPIILIVCRPNNDEAYWISIRDYFSDLATQKTRKVFFDKQSNRFDASCADALKQLALPKESGIYFVPLQKTETLYTNLLKVTFFASKIYVAGTNYRTKGSVWRKFNSIGVKVDSEWILTDKKIFSFHKLDEPPFDAICDLDSCESFDTKLWSKSKDEVTKRHFVQLLNKCLREKTRLLGLDFNDAHQHYYFPATKELEIKKVSYFGIKKMTSQEVFKQYSKKDDPSQRAYCRHSAFEGQFLRLCDEWYLEITPTFHYTSDGYERYKYREERLQGIKRLERNRAVLGHLRMWADYLSSFQDWISVNYPFLRFGQLATVDINTSIPDAEWSKTEEKNTSKQEDSNNQLKLFEYEN